MDTQLPTELRYNIEDYTEEEDLGEGYYGISCIAINKETNNKYVIKKNEHTSIGLEEIKLLAQINYPSLLNMKGYCLIEDDYWDSLLFDYMPNGSLADYIEKKCKGSTTDTRDYIIILGLSIAINYLHKHNITHRSLHPGNVLLDKNFYPVISDFVIPEEFSKIYREQHTWTFQKNIYDPPENITPASNVYSFSYIIYSLITNKMVFSDKKIALLRLRMLIKEQDLRPDLSFVKNDNVRNLLEKCWNKDPSQRPTFDQIIDQITNKEFYDGTFDNLNHDQVKKYLDIFGNEYDHIKNKF